MPYRVWPGAQGLLELPVDPESSGRGLPVLHQADLLFLSCGGINIAMCGGSTLKTPISPFQTSFESL